ncbi:hypothetical protein Bhyg_00140, partial [Pseudolycoriella hygida]
MYGAWQLYNKKNHQQALSLFGRVAAICETNISILTTDQSNNEEADLKKYSDIRERALLMKVCCLNYLKKYQEAEESCMAALPVSTSKTIQASIFSSFAYAFYNQKKDTQVAIGAWKMSVLLNPKSTGYGLLINQLIYHKRYKEIEQLCKHLKASNPEDHNMTTNAVLAYSLWKQGKSLELASMFSEAKKKDPTIIKMIADNYINNLKVREKYKQLKEWCDLVMEFNGGSFNLYLERASALGRQGRYEEAIIDFDKVLRQDDGLMQAHYEKAYCLYQLKQFQEAKDYLHEVVSKTQTFPKTSNWYFNLACFSNECGDQKGALKMLIKLRNIKNKNVDNTNNPDLNCMIANILCQQQKFAEAKIFLNHTLEVAPKNLEAHYVLVNWFRQQNKLTEAIQIIDKIIECKPNTAKAYYIKASIVDQRGQEEDYKIARECFIEAAKLDLKYLNYLEAISYSNTDDDEIFEMVFDNLLEEYSTTSNLIDSKTLQHLSIVIDKVSKCYNKTYALKTVSLEFKQRETIAIIGSSGSGKSTLLRIINGLEPPTSGYGFNLFPHFNVQDNLTYAPINVLKMKPETAIAKAEKLLEQFNLQQKITSFTANLSGGQKQRVAICRALMMDPEIVLFDEPTSALDPENIKDIIEIIALLKDSVTMIVVTHHLKFAKAIADRIIFMDHGQILADQSNAEFFAQPKSHRARLFLENIGDLMIVDDKLTELSWDSTKIVSLFVMILITVNMVYNISRQRNIAIFSLQLLMWMGIFLVIITCYAFRFELNYLYQRVISVLLPSYSWVNEHGEIVINRSSDGHFYINGLVNGVKIKFMIDTGASDVALTTADAEKLNFDLAKLKFTRIYSTANGLSKAAHVQLENVMIGECIFRKVEAHVGSKGLDISLLGMSFLERFKSFRIERDVLILSY